MNTINEEDENPIIEWIVSALGFVCLVALAIQTWFFIDWLMGAADWWMKYMTLCFFDIAGGIWLALSLFHTPPSKGTYQAVRAGIVVDFILSASTTVAWCFIFITRTPLTPDAIAGMVGTARWLVVIAVLFNAFTMIFYSVETRRYHERIKYPHKKRWATESYSRSSSSAVQVAQIAEIPSNPPRITAKSTTNKPDVSTNKPNEDTNDIADPNTNKSKKKLPRRALLGGGKATTK